jgi:hypothetical protein
MDRRRHQIRASGTMISAAWREISGRLAYRRLKGSCQEGCGEQAICGRPSAEAPLHPRMDE